MFQVKICGLTNVEDAQAAAVAGADAIGLNFCSQSSRCIDPSVARHICQTLPPGVLRVGVFVNVSAAIIHELVEVADIRIDLIQLHGDEPPEFLAELGRAVSIPVMRAFRLGPEGGRSILEYLESCDRLGCLPRMILIDAYEPGRYGGTGRAADWAAVRELPRESLPPIVLAGGLTPENVAQAIKTARPAAVDVAGGVEASPGRKDARLVRAFAAAARAAWEDTP